MSCCVQQCLARTPHDHLWRTADMHGTLSSVSHLGAWLGLGGMHDMPPAPRARVLADHRWAAARLQPGGHHASAQVHALSEHDRAVHLTPAKAGRTCSEDDLCCSAPTSAVCEELGGDLSSPPSLAQAYPCGGSGLPVSLGDGREGLLPGCSLLRVEGLGLLPLQRLVLCTEGSSVGTLAVRPAMSRSGSAPRANGVTSSLSSGLSSIRVGFLLSIPPMLA